MGNYNINLLKYPANHHVLDLVHTLVSHSFTHLASRPTRTSTHNLTLTDNIFTNDLSTLVASVMIVLDVSVSDHFLLFHSVERKNLCSSSHPLFDLPY